MLPVMLPVLAGVNVTFNVVLCPGDKIAPDAPLALKPGPEMLTFEIVTLDVPEFVTEIGCDATLPTLTLPKLKDAGFTERVPIAAGVIALDEDVMATLVLPVLPVFPPLVIVVLLLFAALAAVPLVLPMLLVVLLMFAVLPVVPPLPPKNAPPITALGPAVGVTVIRTRPVMFQAR